MTSLAPIALFVYNRVDHVQKTLKYLSNNFLANESDLYIFSDGAKTLSDKDSVNQVRNFCSNIKNFKSVSNVNRDKNYGLAKSLVSGISEILKKNEKIIVLEDDLLADKFFLKYMNEALEKYQKCDEVISVHGYLYPLKNKNNKTFFLKGADCWGWGTWKRGWDLYTENTNFLYSKIIENNKETEFNFNGSYNYLKMLEDNLVDKNSSWAIRWYASAFVNDKLTLYPPHSLIHNIGNDGSGTNSSKSNIYDNYLKNLPVNLDDIIINENKDLRFEFEKYFRSKNNLIKKIFNRIF